MSKKYRTIEQVETAQQRAVRFAQNVLVDDDKAAELASLTPEEYADRKRIQIINPERNRPTMAKQTRAELQQRIDELEEENAQMAERLDQIAELSNGSEEDEADEADDEEEEEDDQADDDDDQADDDE